MILVYLGIVYLVLVALAVQWGTAYDQAVKKGYEGRKYLFMSLIPVYGYRQIILR